MHSTSGTIEGDAAIQQEYDRGRIQNWQDYFNQ